MNPSFGELGRLALDDRVAPDRDAVAHAQAATPLPPGIVNGQSAASCSSTR